MKNILDFCYQKINFIMDQLDMYVLKSNSSIDFNIRYSDTEKLKFKFVGAGSYGNVLRVKNLTHEETVVPTGKYFIMKIMKVKHDEPDRCLKIKRVIKKIKNKKKNTIDSQIKLDLINKYTTNILDVKKGKTNDVIYLEYIPGYDLKDLLVAKTLNIEDVNIIFLMTLISVRIFHKIMKLSHRDLKLENLFYNESSKKVQLIDYSFVCNKEDTYCYRRTQGTAKYIHPKQNKRTTLKYNISKNDSVISFLNSPKTKKKIYNYPNGYSQDLYSCIIILLKLHYQHIRRNKHLLNDTNRWVYNIIEKYNKSFKKMKNKYQEKKIRYQVKNILFKELLSLEEHQMYTPSIKILINILEKYWNVKKRDFVIDNKNDEVVASVILDELIQSLSVSTKITKDRIIEGNDALFNKKEVLDDIFKLQKITVS